MLLDTCSPYRYHVGGSLSVRAPSYVERRADQELYEALLKGQFCYIFNARQTGKSSLRVRIKYRLEQAGFTCASIDVTSIGSERVTPQQWYKGVASELLRGLGLLGKVDFKAWWGEQTGLSPIQQLSRFVEDVLLTQIADEKMVIFIDEVDSILSTGFSLDDFFALIRFFYNQRSHDSKYRRLTFALFGVATPSDLIQDRKRTPFNIGRAIELTGFQMEEARPLLQGFAGRFDHPEEILAEILRWTGGQPFLTQKLCQMVIKTDDDKLIPDSKTLSDPAQIADWTKALVQSQMIDNWESQDDPEHLKTIRDRLLRNPQRAGRLLGVYQEIWRQGAAPADDSPEQIELQLSGLVVKRGGKLTVLNQIYQAVFNQSWLNQQFAQLRPYAKALDAWLESNRQDDSHLLRGQPLQDAQRWADSRSLSDLDYQFFAASQALENQEMHQVELARVQVAEAQLAKQKAISQWQRLVLGTMSVGFVVITGLALTIAGIAIGNKYEHKAQEIQADAIEEILEIKDLEQSLTQLIAHERELITWLDNPDQFQTTYEIYQVSAREFQEEWSELLAEYKTDIEAGFEEAEAELEFLADLVENYDGVIKTYLQTVDQFIADLNLTELQGKELSEARQSLIDINRRPAALKLEEFSEKLSDLVEIIEEEELKAAEEVKETVVRTRNQGIAISVVLSLVIAGLLALILICPERHNKAKSDM